MTSRRTCIGCRTAEDPASLLRLARVDGAVVPNPGGRIPGRGAWIHPDPACVEMADRRRAWGRALRSVAALDTSAVRDAVTRRV